MAKAKMPLMGLEARGQLGKAIVFTPWKGINSVRQHVVPANPNTTDQANERANFTAFVTAWHDSNNLADDKSAWNRRATTEKGSMSGFNKFIGWYRENSGYGGSPCYMFSMIVASNTGGTVTVDFYVSDDTSRNIPCKYGNKAGSLLYSQNATRTGANAWQVVFSGLNSGDELFWKAVDDQGATEGETGIYRVKVA